MGPFDPARNYYYCPQTWKYSKLVQEICGDIATDDIHDDITNSEVIGFITNNVLGQILMRVGDFLSSH